ncbi:MAG: DUF1844 domain-containing protein [Myxococcota bacterium]|nr:DUF1844 domain-containing protein [Myxococcota bacterium]
MSEEEQEKKGFRIVDKRRFNSEGETRADAPERPEPPPQPAAPPRQAPPAQRTDARGPSASPTDDTQPRQQQQRGGGMDFISFIASLATQALAALGALPEARAQGMPVSIEMAREYIEIIAMLQDKTRGNLSREEDAALQRVMTELRMVYVEVTQRGAKAPQPQPKR